MAVHPLIRSGDVELRMTPWQATMVLLLLFSRAHRGGLVADRLD
ncbi:MULTISPECIES: hypothetical protein [Pseudomonas]|jgi:hypothetical protein|nr:hypothetical protein [Pseudomonas mosselii]